MNLIFNIIFSLLALVLSYLFFRPQKGWWYRLKESKVSRERIILEDLLKNLYHAKEEGVIRNIKSLIKQLPSGEQQTLRVLRNMEGKALVEISNKKVRLTTKGEEYAVRMVRAHRLWEQFLAEKTGYDKKDWHKLAEKAEHKLTEEHLEKLSKELKRPLFDPHGSPIPYNQKDIPEISGHALPFFPKGTIGKIVHIQDEPAAIYQKLLDEDIHMGAQVEILEKTAQMVCFFSEGKQHELEPIVANALTIVPLEDEDITEHVERLSRLKVGEKAIVKGISKECRGENRRRLLDLGFVKDTQIAISSISPLGDPIAYMLRDTLIALRSEQAQYVLIQKKEKNA